MTVNPLGDSAVVISFGDTIDRAMVARVQAVADEVRRSAPAGMVDVVPAFASIALFFEPGQAPELETLRAEIAAIVARAAANGTAAGGRAIEIPVCYGGTCGPDLDELAARAGLTPAEVIARHTGAEYLVHAIGFSPGFPYLGGLPPELATPRRATPRTRVPAGSVGIGGAQTGVYPLETPGGWNLIGRTPCVLFDPGRAEPALLRAGDSVRFRAVPEAEYPANAPLVDTDRAPLAGIEVRRAGMHTTVQDLGRVGHRAEGVPGSGAADSFALRVANLLVGNAEGATGLEFTQVGPELIFPRATVVALCGAEFEGLPLWRPVRVAAGTILQLGAARRGCRGYLAVAGGIEVAPVLGSRSTYVRGGFGGLRGAALRDHDIVPAVGAARPFRENWHVDPRILPAYSSAPTVRVVRGAQAGEFPDRWLETRFTVSRQSDRMGVRLEGPAVQRAVADDLISSAVAPGTIQVPPDGQPIVLLADAQTIGGYPQIAHVATVDLPLMAQLRPGDTVSFREVTLGDAQMLIVAREHSLALLREGLKEKWG